MKQIKFIEERREINSTEAAFLFGLPGFEIGGAIMKPGKNGNNILEIILRKFEGWKDVSVSTIEREGAVMEHRAPGAGAHEHKVKLTAEQMDTKDISVGFSDEDIKAIQDAL
jgi:hypothetical protein